MLVNTEQQARRFQQLAAAVVDQVSNVIIGQREVIRDTVVCLIEAMKVMNEIKAEVKGTITEVLVEEGKPVEYGQSLFRIGPN